jgi:hypothetical protein
VGRVSEVAKSVGWLRLRGGSGELTVDGVTCSLRPGRAVLVPRGATRALHCTAGPLVYLTCHRRRAGLMPS